MSVLLYPPCPTDCAGSLPEPSFDECAPVLGYGEVEKIYLQKANADDFSDVEDLGEWTTKKALAISDDNAVREFTVKGDLPAPATTEVVISQNRTIRGSKKFTLNFQIDEDNDKNYEAHLLFECNTKFKMRFATADGMLFGGNEAILASILTDYIIPPERTAVRYIAGKAIWDSKKSPLRSINPNA